SLRQLAPDGVVIVAAVLDGVVEDRRVRRQAGDGEFVDIAAQRAGSQQVARDVVEPEALPQVVQDSSGVHDITSIAAPGWRALKKLQPPPGGWFPTSGRHACPSRASRGSAAAGPALPAA